MLLSGCTTIPQSPEFCVREPAIIQALAEEGGWTAQGRLAVRQGDDGWQVKMRWQQQSSQFRIQLDPIIGSGLRFDGTDEHVVMSKSTGEPVSAGHPEQLLHQETGFHFPLTQLRYWVLGLSNETLGLETKTCPTHFNQDDWKVEYGPYQLINNTSLPRKVTITNDDVRVRLIIDNWNLSP